MEERHKIILRKNHSLLLNDVALDDVKHYLYENSILNDIDMEKLSLQTYTRTEKGEMFFIHMLPKRGPDAYETFLEALRQDGQSAYIVVALENTEVTQEDINRFRGIIKVDGEKESLESVEYWDFALFHAHKSENEALYFKEFLENNLVDNYGAGPKIWHIECDPDAYEKTMINNIESALDKSRYFLIYIDYNFNNDNWSNFQKEQCLWKYFEEGDKKCNVPVLVEKDLKAPFGLGQLRPIDLWKITHGKTMKDFMETNSQMDLDGKRVLEKLQTWFSRSVVQKRPRNTIIPIPDLSEALSEALSVLSVK